MKTKPTFTLLAFHYYKGEIEQFYPALSPLLDRLDADCVRADQGVYILRSREDAALLAECRACFLSLHKSYASVQFDPSEEQALRHGYIDPPMVKRFEEWMDTLQREGN
jgi:hypothetical protein